MRYQQLQDSLNNAGAMIGASECHGIFSGVLSIAAQLPAGSIRDALFDDETDLASESVHQLMSSLETLAAVVSEELNDENFDFSLLLPEDDESLSIRTAELKQWCQGFLYGLGIAGLSISDSNESELAEVLNDISSIGKLVEQDIEATDDNERDFFELHEFVRMSALYVQELYRAEVDAVDDLTPH